jgi:hypothetical protein
MLHDVGKLEELCYERAVGYTTEGQLLGHIVMELETVAKAMEEIEGFPAKLKTVVQHILISHHGQYEFGSPKLPMIREALVFHYMDDLDSKLAAVRAAMDIDSGEAEWSAYSGALGRKFLRLNKYLTEASVDEGVLQGEPGGPAAARGSIGTREKGSQKLTARTQNFPRAHATSWNKERARPLPLIPR